MSQLALVEKVQYLYKNNIGGIAEHMEREITCALGDSHPAQLSPASLECLAIDLTYLAMHNQDWQASTTYRAFASNYVTQNYHLSFAKAELLIERSSGLLPPSHSLSCSRIATERYFVEYVVLNILVNNNELIKAIGLGKELSKVVENIVAQLNSATPTDAVTATDSLLGHITSIAVDVIQLLESNSESLVCKQLKWSLTPVCEPLDEQDQDVWVACVLKALLHFQARKSIPVVKIHAKIREYLPKSLSEHSDTPEIIRSFINRLICNESFICVNYHTNNGANKNTLIEYGPDLHRLLGSLWLEKNLAELQSDPIKLEQILGHLPMVLQDQVVRSFRWKSTDSLKNFTMRNARSLAGKPLELLMKKIISSCPVPESIEIARDLLVKINLPWSRKAVCKAFENQVESPLVRQFLESVASSDSSPSVQDIVVRVLSQERQDQSNAGVEK